MCRATQAGRQRLVDDASSSTWAAEQAAQQRSAPGGASVDRYANRAQVVVLKAQNHARDRGQAKVTSVDLRFGLLAEWEGLAGQAMEVAGVSAETLRAAATEALPAAGRPNRYHVDFSVGLERVYELTEAAGASIRCSGMIAEPGLRGHRSADRKDRTMETRRLGRLAHSSSVLIYGAAALGDVSQDVADRSIQQALDGGINHVDVAADYGDAELRLGPWMAEIRDRIFLATKTGQREREAAWAQINASLERLQTDHVDLLQLHAVGDLAELDRATAADGALTAAVRAQEEGLVGAVGITGHGDQAPATHLEALRRFPFATVLTPLNPVLWRDPQYRSDYQALVAEVQRQDAGLMTIKTASRRNWPADDEPHRYATWYEPYDVQQRITAAVSWVLAHEEITGIPTPGDVSLLGLLLAAEGDRTDPAEAERVLADDDSYSSPFVSMPF